MPGAIKTHTHTHTHTNNTHQYVQIGTQDARDYVKRRGNASLPWWASKDFGPWGLTAELDGLWGEPTEEQRKLAFAVRDPVLDVIRYIRASPRQSTSCSSLLGWKSKKRSMTAFCHAVSAFRHFWRFKIDIFVCWQTLPSTSFDFGRGCSHANCFTCFSHACRADEDRIFCKQ